MSLTGINIFVEGESFCIILKYYKIKMNNVSLSFIGIDVGNFKFYVDLLIFKILKSL